jgi:hypothetical protein
MYYDYDGVSPLGRSMVDIAGDLQNLIDADMQAYQFNRALGLQPPVVVSGDLDSGSGIYMPNNVLVSDDPASAIKVLTVDTTAITSYPQLYALQKSQLYNLIANADDTTISSEATGGLASSKTSTGIKQNQVAQSIIDNFFFKNAEAFLSAWAENALNIYLGEFSGVIELQLDNEYANKVRAEDPSKVSDDGRVLLDCSTVTRVRVKVEPGSTRDVAKSEDLERLNSLITMAGQSEIVARMIGTPAFQEIIISMIKTSGITNSGDIIKAIQMNSEPTLPGDEPAQPEPAQPDPSIEMDMANKEQQMAQDAEMHQMKMAKIATDIKMKGQKNEPTTTR